MTVTATSSTVAPGTRSIIRSISARAKRTPSTTRCGETGWLKRVRGAGRSAASVPGGATRSIRRTIAPPSRAPRRSSGPVLAAAKRANASGVLIESAVTRAARSTSVGAWSK